MRRLNLPIALLASTVLSGTALAQTFEITSFSGNGQLTWTNVDTNLFYRIEWATSLTAPVDWHSDYFALTDIQSTDSIVTSTVPIFYRVCGSSSRTVFSSSQVAKTARTGQTASYQIGDDGYYTNGVTWPSPRFAIQDDTNCVLDNMTGLIWARNASVAGVTKSWSNALLYCESLTYGGTNDWRLPNRRELLSLIDDSRNNPALCNTAGTAKWTAGDPFNGVVSGFYWSSTTPPGWTPGGWAVNMNDGDMGSYSKGGSLLNVWPVRGGQ